ncbi:hypothetical protein HAHE_27990 [Haloferula helveola]|uniref:PDZ domain-containing protein n=1 Tax=Haloferula helveola TaxID=490095 RepID=A0ABM7RFC1_9BACT|nr:hypothetical protein HAHE_27990 [Haloferula helveola]
MRSRYQVRLLFWVGLLGAGVLWLPLTARGGEEPPENLVQQLASERYPDRVAAQGKLAEWSKENGKESWDWLTRVATEGDNPEVRDRVLVVLKALVLGELEQSRPGFVGITMSSVKVGGEADDGIGVQVLAVSKNSPADKAGLKAGDVVVSLEGKTWKTENAQDEFAGRVGALKPGTEVNLGILRGGERLDIDLTLAARPWSAGEYGDLQRRNFDPFAPGGLMPTERQARERVFREWLDERLGR